MRLLAWTNLAVGAVSGAATALVGMAGPPVLVYLLLTGAGSQATRATLLALFAAGYAASLAARVATAEVAMQTWLTAGVMLLFAVLGGLVGRRLGDRLGAGDFRYSRSVCSRSQVYSRSLSKTAFTDQEPRLSPIFFSRAATSAGDGAGNAEYLRLEPPSAPSAAPRFAGVAGAG